MSDKKAMILDKDNINLLATSFPDKRKIFKSFLWKEINEIRVKDEKVGFLFFKKPTEKIEILTQNPETPSYLNPIVLYKHKDETNFDEYLKDLKEYSEMKSVTFIDNRKNS